MSDMEKWFVVLKAFDLLQQIITVHATNKTLSHSLRLKTINAYHADETSGRVKTGVIPFSARHKKTSQTNV